MFKEINFHSKVLLDIDWNCDGQYLGSSSYDKTVKIGQLETSGNVKVVQTGNNYILFIALYLIIF